MQLHSWAASQDTPGPYLRYVPKADTQQLDCTQMPICCYNTPFVCAGVTSNPHSCCGHTIFQLFTCRWVCWVQSPVFALVSFVVLLCVWALELQWHQRAVHDCKTGPREENPLAGQVQTWQVARRDKPPTGSCKLWHVFVRIPPTDPHYLHPCANSTQSLAAEDGLPSISKEPPGAPRLPRASQ